MTPLTILLLFVALLTSGFLVEAIRYWLEMRQHDRAWQGGPWFVTESHVASQADHPDLIVANLSEMERQIIAEALQK
jgi:hypothetical protein